ncbi:MAG: hypothetical protein J0L77_03680 [Alphaproteobacteria bacterium]|nr:hypothetical protein [Alphaproteobacteria bacterium]
MSGKIDFRGMMNGTVDIKGALASADNRAPDARPTTPDQVLRNIPSALSGLAAENPATGTVATTSIAASLLSRVTNGSWNPLNVFRGVAPAGLVAQTADDAGRGLGGVLKSVLGKLPWYGKAGVLVGVGVGANSILSSDALAAPSTPVAPLNRTPSGVPAIAPVVSETAPTGRSLAINAINGAYSGALNGVATFAGAPVDGATWLINKTVGRGLGFQIDRPFLGSESINNGLTGLRGAYHRATGNDLDRVQPANTAERVAYEGASFAGNLAASGGALGLLRGAWAKVASGVFTPTAPVSHAAPISRPALAGGTMDGFHMN